MSLSNIQTKINSLPVNHTKSNFAKNFNKVGPIPLQENNFLQDLEDLPQNTTLEFTPKKSQVNTFFQESSNKNINPKGKENQPKYVSPLRISVSRTRSSSQPKDADLAANQSDSSRAVSPIRKNIINLSENGKEPGSEIRVFGVPSDNQITTPRSQTDLTQSGGNILHLSQMYAFDKTTKESQGIEYSQNELPEIMETAVNENGDWDRKPEKKYIETSFTSNHKVPKWKKLKSVFQSLVLFQTQEVRQLDNAKAINQEVDSFALRTSHVTPISKEQKLKDQNDPLTLLRRIEEFCECAAVGSSDHIAHMKYLIKKDPKKFMLSTEDPLHFINSLNTKGQSALYIAAKNGNTEVVKLLIENNVNHLIKSKVNSSGPYEETALEVATRWGHQIIINMLLQNYKFADKVIKACLKMSPNSNVKAQIKEYMKQNKIKSRGGFFFVCSKY